METLPTNKVMSPSVFLQINLLHIHIVFINATDIKWYREKRQDSIKRLTKAKQEKKQFREI